MEDTVTNRQTRLGLLDPATDPAAHARAATATVTDLKQLAERQHATADPAALLTPGRRACPDGDRSENRSTYHLRTDLQIGPRMVCGRVAKRRPVLVVQTGRD